jgi:hypothetical protein
MNFGLPNNIHGHKYIFLKSKIENIKVDLAKIFCKYKGLI